MNRKELAALVAEKHDLPKVRATEVLDSVLDALAAELKKGNAVALAGFGTFKVAERAARTGRNPSTGEKVKIAARKLVKFSAASALAGLVDPKFAKAKAAKKSTAEAVAPKKTAAKKGAAAAPVKAAAKKPAATKAVAPKAAATKTPAAKAPAAKKATAKKKA